MEMESLDPSASERAGGESSRLAAEEDPLPQLPFEIVLDIVQRSDVVTVVRCAATHKLLRQAILAAPAFRRRLGVHPDNLLGFSLWGHGGRRTIDTPPIPTAAATGGLQRLVRLDYDAITGIGPVASRDGLLVVGRFHGTGHCNTCACAMPSPATSPLPFPPSPSPSSPPPLLCRRMIWPWPRSYTFVLLTAAGHSFGLLVTNTGMQTQVFSSDLWEWGPVRDTSFSQHQHQLLAHPYYRHFSCPAVIGQAVYWLCSANHLSADPVFGGSYLQPGILSLDVDAAEATLMKVPPYCFSDMVHRSWRQFDARTLLTAVRGQLWVFVLEMDGIWACTPTHQHDYSETPTWSRQLMLTRPELEARAALDPGVFTQLRLHAYGERSGSMILEVTPGIFLRLDIGEAFSLARLVRLGSQDSKATNTTLLCLHEIHIVMKSFP